jgi:ubiquinone/menaquinone biosynthesis C-methylase UbiE
MKDPMGVGDTLEINLQRMKTFNNYDKWMGCWNKGLSWGEEDVCKTFLQNTIRDKFTKVNNLLEIAPGFGRLTKLLFDYCENLYAIDLNETCINFCKNNFPKGNFILTNGKMIPFKDNFFDFIVCYDSMVHFHSDIIYLYMQEISRVLKNNSYAVLHHAANGESRVGWRSNMTDKLMVEFATKTNLLIDDKIYLWKLEDGSFNDVITILKKK